MIKKKKKNQNPKKPQAWSSSNSDSWLRILSTYSSDILL